MPPCLRPSSEAVTRPKHKHPRIQSRIEAVVPTVRVVETRFGFDVHPPHRHVQHPVLIQVVIQASLRRHAPGVFQIEVAQPGAFAVVVELLVKESGVVNADAQIRTQFVLLVAK